ncbi:MAG: AraC family transcriptional regulator [Alistipes sp.]|nr:AraC family transcriptional regulator [Alistipes sp.]
MSLSKLIKQYIVNDNISSYVIDDHFAIIENPVFSILPNHPYRNPLVVVVYCTSGFGKGRVNTHIYNLQRHSMMIVLPRQITELIDLSDDFQATYIIMSDEFVSSLGIGNTFSISNIVASSPKTVLQDRAKESLDSYLSMCRNLIPIDNNPNRLEILQLLTKAFFLGLGYFLHGTNKESNSRNEELTASFIKLVEMNYMEHRELSFYADRLNITSKHLSRVVKETSGKSAMEWIEKHVILDAISQLLSSNISIKEIAYRLNFPSQSCFGKYFNRVVGISPTTYREQHSTHQIAKH